MIVDFSKISVKEQPLLILQNLDDTPVGVLGAAYNVEVNLCFNEISTLTFDLPARLDGKETAYYKKAVGMRIVELRDYGRFLMVDPKIKDNGVKEVKECTAYSLEYEFTFKTLPLTAGTYNFWNPVAKKDTILGRILDVMPSWEVGAVDATLYDKYRTFDDSKDQNLYNFIKSDLQEAYGCIFIFDTYRRKIIVRDVSNDAVIQPVFFSMENLVKEVTIEEDSENIITKLNVNGADGVDIHSVNPMGTNYLIDLGYFMTPENFSQAMIQKYNNWKETFASYQRQYFNLTVEEALKVAQLITEQAALTTLQGELTSFENIQAVTIQGIAKNLKSQSDLTAVNQQISAKKAEITQKEAKIRTIQSEADALNAQMVEINRQTDIERFFTPAEYKIVNRYLKEGTITEDSFVAPEVDNYDAAGASVKVNGSTFRISGATVLKVTNGAGKDIYSVVGGNISCSISGFVLQSNIVRANLDHSSDGALLFTARLNSGTLNSAAFPNACISISGSARSVSSDVTPDQTVGGVLSEGSTLNFQIATADLYFTRSTTEYEQRAVEWDLFDYGTEFLEKVAYPAYTLSLDLANFLALAEYEPFKQKLELGTKLYWQQRDGSIMKPILLNVRIPFEDLTKFKVELSSKYNASNPEFFYKDIIEDAKTAGSTINSGRWTYNQFVESGAETSLNKFMKSALDIAKNNILSTSGQDIRWDQAGFRLRKRKDGSETEYEPYQIWMNNSSIMFTTDNWSTANLAIGQIVSEGGTVLSGVIADSLIGKLLAGNSMIIESVKKDGKGNAVFRVDGNGASLHNAAFDIYNANQTHITLNPYSGIAIGKYPLYTDNEYTIDTENAVFWVDTQGNLHIKGTLEGVNGTFSGELKAATGTFSGELKAATGTFKGDLSAANGTFSGTLKAAQIEGALKGSSSGGWLEGIGIRIGQNAQATKGYNFYVDTSGNVWMQGSLTLKNGAITWNNLDSTTKTQVQNAANAAADAASDAADALDAADGAADLARDIANGRFQNGTFINGTSIYSPTIYADEFVVKPRNTASYGRFSGGYAMYGYYGSTLMEMLLINYYHGDAPVVCFSSPCRAYADWDFGYTTFNGSLDFSHATVTGLTATFG